MSDLTVWKYQLDLFAAASIRLDIPVGRFGRSAQVLHVDTQHDNAFIWVLVDPTAATEVRAFRVYGTGHPVPLSPGEHVGTFMINGGEFVGHLFEVAT